MDAAPGLDGEVTPHIRGGDSLCSSSFELAEPAKLEQQWQQVQIWMLLCLQRLKPLSLKRHEIAWELKNSWMPALHLLEK